MGSFAARAREAMQLGLGTALQLGLGKLVASVRGALQLGLWEACS